MTIAEKAAKARQWFERANRNTGEPGPDEWFWRTKDDEPQWVTDLCMAAHDNAEILPDDYRYAVLVEALDMLAENPELSAEELYDLLPDFEDGADAYNSQLAEWLGSRAIRAGYVDEAREAYGAMDAGDGFGVMDWIRAGQMYERQEVFQAVVDFLANLDDEAE